ncbi:phosphopantetheine-binding protein [Streptomyces sp. NPDC007861]|uniref:AMP-binding enzyme n=1 Tax=Streptomyces sp. NPDC007861 TaxID=3154893 RepID=UPI0033F65015
MPSAAHHSVYRQSGDGPGHAAVLNPRSSAMACGSSAPSSQPPTCESCACGRVRAGRNGALAAFPETLECAVVRKEDHEGDALLAAYVRLTPAGTVQQLRGYAQTRIPEWMCPSTYELVDEIPLTAAGKIDRTALARTITAAVAARPAEPETDGTADAKPHTATEELLTRIRQEVLGEEHVGLDDHFFQSGGHSLLAIRVVARPKRQAQLTIPLTAVFENPVLRDLAAYVEQAIRERLASS